MIRCGNVYWLIVPNEIGAQYYADVYISIGSNFGGGGLD
jgi:hypothetical protein